MDGKFFMVEGIDGSGKSTAVNAIKDYVISKNLKVLDLRAFCEQKNTFPDDDEIAESDIIFTSEPSYSFVGKALRTELLSDDNSYPAWTMAHAFALDREILYKRVVLPALKKNKIVVQERGLPSTMVYQPIQDKISLSELMRLPGNKIAAENPPDTLLILKTKFEEAISRLNARFSNKYSIFDNLLFQRKIEERYSSLWLRGYFEKLGTKVYSFGTSSPVTVEQNRKNALRLFQEMVGNSVKAKEKQTQL
ncbi:MAG TPA: hypothetical protein VJB90_02570 [Candidatus Nanoarchaeia archaeon]|nr:hypothetical protein [Candidatus Nanoarchaeia archaeon]